MPDDPFQPMLDELAKFLKLAEENASKPMQEPIDPLFERKLEALEDKVKAFRDFCNEEIAKNGTTPTSALEKLKNHPEQFSSHEQKILRQCRDLGLNAVILRAGLARAKLGQSFDKQHQMGTNTKKSIQKRRNRFKGMGGDADWKRL